MRMKLIMITCLTLIVGQMAAQNNSANRKKEFNHENGLAIQGYDPVAYFKQGKALKGSKEFFAETKGITYRFASATNRDLFIATPEKYEPAYGGWCAYAMGANNEKVEVDPETFKVLDGKLYLFYNQYFNNTLKSWNKDEANLRKRADSNWLKYFHP